MSCVGTPMQLASCGAPVKLPAPELGLELGLDVHPAGRSESTSSAFLACAVWAEVAAAAAGPAPPAVESTAVITPASDQAISSPAGAWLRTGARLGGRGEPPETRAAVPTRPCQPARGPLCLALTTREC
jgi:hypothetical protein